MHIRCLFLSSLVACSGGGDGGEITIHTPEGSFLVARNDGDAVWVAPEKVDATTFRFIATGPYRITQGCDRDESTGFVRQVARTLDDAPELDFACDDPVDTDAVITSTMVQPGTVATGSLAVTSETPNWEVVLSASEGTHAVIAHSDDHVALFRNIQVQGERVMPTFDVAAQGVPVVRGALTATNADPTETVSALVVIEIGDTVEFFHEGDPAATKFVPDDLLESGDEQYIELSATRDGAGRFALSPRAGAAALTLPDPIVDPAFTSGVHDLSATWEASLTGDVVLTRFAFDSNFTRFWIHQLDASAAYGALGSASLDLDSIPDLPETLLVDVEDVEQVRLLSVFDAGAQQGITFTANPSSTATVAPRRLPPQVARMLRHRR